MYCVWVSTIETWEKAHSKNPSKVLELIKNQRSKGAAMGPPWEPFTGTAWTLLVWHGSELQCLWAHTFETVRSEMETRRAWGTSYRGWWGDSGLFIWTYEKEFFVPWVPCESAGGWSFIMSTEGEDPLLLQMELSGTKLMYILEAWKASVYLNSGLHAVRVLPFK